MPVLGEKNFEDAVQKVMASGKNRTSAEKIVGAAEKKARLLKARLKIAVRVFGKGFDSGSIKKRDIPTEGRGINTRRENPATPLGTKVPFGKKPTKAISRKQQINRMVEENRAITTGGRVDPRRNIISPKKGFKSIISAKKKIDYIKTAQKHEHMIEFKRHFRGADQFKKASLESQQGKYAHYWLLNAKDSNGNGWGVAQQSIAKNIQKFKGKPFVVTAQTWVANSEYGDQYEHPYLRTNNLNTIYAHQEKFRVGTITDIKEKNGEYFAQIEMKPKYASMRLPPFCSPAIFQLDPMEAEGNITKWEALHLAGLMEDPAYGARIAILRGSCMGTPEQCTIQFRTAKSLCPTGKKIAKGLAQRISALRSSTNRAVDRVNVRSQTMGLRKKRKKLSTRISALHGNTNPQVKKKKVKTNGIKGKTTEIRR